MDRNDEALGAFIARIGIEPSRDTRDAPRDERRVGGVVARSAVRLPLQGAHPHRRHTFKAFPRNAYIPIVHLIGPPLASGTSARWTPCTRRLGWAFAAQLPDWFPRAPPSPWPGHGRLEQYGHRHPQCVCDPHKVLHGQVDRAGLNALHVARRGLEPLREFCLRQRSLGPQLRNPTSDSGEGRRGVGGLLHPPKNWSRLAGNKRIYIIVFTHFAGGLLNISGPSLPSHAALPRAAFARIGALSVEPSRARLILTIGLLALLLGACKPSNGGASATSRSAPTRAATVPVDRPVTVQIAVRVEATKADGSFWDGASDGPDIALCVVGASRTQCYPEGQNAESVPRAHCENSISCTFAFVVLPADTYSLRVVDVDTLADDDIGSGDCAVGSTCTLGRARVTIEDVREIAARRRREEEAVLARFRAMTPAEHLAAAQTAMSTNYNAETQVGGDIDEAQRHLDVIPRGTPERRTADGLVREIAARARRARALAARVVREMRAQLQREREAIAARLDGEFIRHGVEVDNVRTTGAEGTTLRIRYAGCGRVFIDRFARSNGRELQQAGFRRVECASAFETAWISLE